MKNTKTCPDCGQQLEPVTFYVHHNMTREIEWLLENRRAIAGEQDIDAVIGRLIRLEVDKRKTIEERKAENAARREREVTQRPGK